MPTYLYRCTACPYTEDRVHGADERPRGLACPHCGGLLQKGIHNQFAVIKGVSAPVVETTTKAGTHTCTSPHCCVSIIDELIAEADTAADE